MIPALITRLKTIYPINYWIHKRNLRRTFPAEILRLADQDCPQNSEAQSIIFFTVHKCASVYVNGILRQLTGDGGMIPIDFAKYLWQDGRSIQEILSNPKIAQQAFKPQGYFYGSFREFQPIPNLDQYRIILMLRDPRDVLTSLYFSQAYSHEEPSYLLGKKPTWRTNAQSQTIDEFVKENIPIYLQRYHQHIHHLLGEPNVLFLKYEDMVLNFESWFNQLIEFLPIEVQPSQITKIIKKANLKVQKEDIYSHKRQVIPGDYQRKLTPEMITLLNQEFKEILEQMNYQ